MLNKTIWISVAIWIAALIFLLFCFMYYGTNSRQMEVFIQKKDKIIFVDMETKNTWQMVKIGGQLVMIPESLINIGPEK